MTDTDLERRLQAVERALTDGEDDVAGLADAATLTDRVEDHDERLATLEERVDDLDAATQAVRGYVGSVRSVNEDVERRADAALAAVERLEDDLDASGSVDAAGSGTALDGGADDGDADGDHAEWGTDSRHEGAGSRCPTCGARPADETAGRQSASGTATANPNRRAAAALSQDPGADEAAGDSGSVFDRVRNLL